MVKEQFGKPDIETINYKTNPEWHEEVLKLTNGIGVDLVVENGGSSSLVKSMLCTRRGGIVSQVGYLGGPKPEHLKEFVATIIDRRLNIRSVTSPSILRSWIDLICVLEESTVAPKTTKKISWRRFQLRR